MAPRDRAPASVVILVADGARPDTLAAAMDAGHLPALARLRAEAGAWTTTSVFPSVTGPAYAPFLTGRYPGPVGLPGIRWYDRARTASRWPAWSRSYVGMDMRMIATDLDPAAPSLFELEPSHLGALSVIERGLPRRNRAARGATFVARAALTHFSGHVAGWLGIDRAVAAQVAARVSRERPRFTFCALTGIDKTSHAEGHAAPVVRDAMRIVDDTAARIRADAERDGRWDDMHLWVVSDHGHSPVTTHEDLAGLIRSWGVPVRAHPWVFGPGHRAAVMVSGNAMAHVYLELDRRARPWWPALADRWEWLAGRLLDRAATDLLILPVCDGTTEVRARGRGTARVTAAAGRYSYRPATGDPLGLGELGDLDADEAHDATQASDYPDALVQVASLASAARSGDLIVSAARHWDLRARWEPIPHVSSHGALHREHMLVPLLVNRRPVVAPRRTVDVFASACHALGAAVPATDGRSWLPRTEQPSARG
ncbi:MAG TPA: alkaline phosphatase family protein [Gemmatimonadaceae bacterium]|nr:alkaline phosphatase family protein [Gemmatimonadaceae bacterium]